MWRQKSANTQNFILGGFRSSQIIFWADEFCAFGPNEEAVLWTNEHLLGSLFWPKNVAQETTSGTQLSQLEANSLAGYDDNHIEAVLFLSSKHDSTTSSAKLKCKMETFEWLSGRVQRAAFPAKTWHFPVDLEPRGLWGHGRCGGGAKEAEVSMVRQCHQVPAVVVHQRHPPHRWKGKREVHRSHPDLVVFSLHLSAEIRWWPQSITKWL